jgi:glycerophosphoryl diester phosphodiesterase
MPYKFLLSMVAIASLAACGGGGDVESTGGTVQPQAVGQGGRIAIVAHRGASGYLPEHTLEAYAKAIELGADMVEPDLVATRDGVLIARHEPNLVATTDVALKFPERRRKAVVDGVEEEGFFASDFTLAEIKTLRAVQAFADRSQAYNGQFQIPTFDEVLDLVRDKAQKSGRTVGVYPETKHPTYHQQLGLPLEDRLLASLERVGWNRAGAPVFIQSFETANLKALRQKTRVRLIQLVDADSVDPRTGAITYAPPFDRPYDWTATGRSGTFGDLLTPAGLDEVKSYADGIAPWKRYLVTVKARLDAQGNPTDVNGDGAVNESDFDAVANPALAAAIKQRGLLLHTWTFRSEPRRLAATYGGDPRREYWQFFDLGIDGLFSDFTDTAVAAREAWQKQRAN